ncbi:MAG: helix-turn-helix transcriptional regulator [Clostridia bacterium]|nr:helix-turn-helix transcriptional regulator [Clostridia bacterium]
MNNIGKRIKELRKKKDMTQEKLADMLGITYKAVSKWECGMTTPDISLIVPLARLLEVSTDDLLGMPKIELDKQKAEFDRLYNAVHSSAQYEIACKAVNEYPNEIKYLRWKADCIYMRAYDDYSTQEVFLNEIENAYKIYKFVFENTDGELQNDVLTGIVMTLAVLKRNEEAKKYALMYPKTQTIDRDTLLGYALNGEEKLEHSQKMILKHLDALISIMTNIRDKNDPNKQELKYLTCSENIINIFFPAGDYNRYYDEMMLISIYKAIIYQYEDKEKALESLINAKKYAECFDRLFITNPSKVKYDTPYLDQLEFDAQELVIIGQREENKRIDIFKSWLDGACFDILREYAGYNDLYN